MAEQNGGATWRLTPLVSQIDRFGTSIHWILDVKARDFFARITRTEASLPTKKRINQIDSLMTGCSVSTVLDILRNENISRIQYNWYDSMVPPGPMAGQKDPKILPSEFARVLRCNQRGWRGHPKTMIQTDSVWNPYKYLNICKESHYLKLVIAAIRDGHLIGEYHENRDIRDRSDRTINVDGRIINRIQLGLAPGVF